MKYLHLQITTFLLLRSPVAA